MRKRSPNRPNDIFSKVRIFIYALVLMACGFVATECRASNESGKNLVFILDASGSMVAKVQGQAKIVTAKKVLSGFVNDLPAGVNVGLVTYGHRNKKDCRDVEELVPLGPPDKKDLIARINSIKPKGMTPITYSIQKVAEGLKSVRGETTIVLVSDGEETCGGDPCAVVRALKASGIKFVMHVIGFDVNKQEKAQLSCIAEAGGGSFYTAANARDFALATKKIVEKTRISAATLNVKALRNGKPFSAYCQVFKPAEGADKNKNRVVDGWTGDKGYSFKLAPGVYDLSVENRQDVGSRPMSFNSVKVEPGK
ncbi:MAG: VWA domain-containing protein, partial [Syntrophobacteraceae bacterium]|nr:VWA domain-containing protein [Syntrophobacteraceae bacterium]